MLRVLFAGSPQAAKITLEKLLECAKECDYQIVGVLSNPPSAKGRHKELTPTPVAEFAMQNNIPVIDYSKCTGCKTCVSKCPRKCIREI